MNKTEIERLITTALTEHAERTMNDTDTRQELDLLILGSEQQSGRRRNGVIAAGIAAVAVVAAFVTWGPGAYEPDAVPKPAEPPLVLTAEEQLGTDFVTAYAAFDRDLMTSYLADDAHVSVGLYEVGIGKDAWRRVNRFDEATDFRLTLDRCYEVEALEPDGALVGCLFVYDAFHSQELGRGPFGDQVFEFTIHEGQITLASMGGGESADSWPAEMLDPFNKWLTKNHPDEGSIIDAWKSREATQAQVEQSLAFWSQITQEYVAAVKAGEAE